MAEGKGRYVLTKDDGYVTTTEAIQMIRQRLLAVSGRSVHDWTEVVDLVALVAEGLVDTLFILDVIDQRTRKEST